MHKFIDNKNAFMSYFLSSIKFPALRRKAKTLSYQVLYSSVLCVVFFPVILPLIDYPSALSKCGYSNNLLNNFKIKKKNSKLCKKYG